MNFVEQLKDLENIDWNDFSSWPIAIKLVGVVVIGIGILIAGYWFIIKGEIEDLDKIQAQEKRSLPHNGARLDRTLTE